MGSYAGACWGDDLMSVQRFTLLQRLQARLGRPLDTVLVAQAWRAAEKANAPALAAALTNICQMPAPARRIKGAPDLVGLRASIAARLAALSVPALTTNPVALADARLLAALQVDDVHAFLIYQQVFALQHASLLTQLHQQVGQHLVLHMTCVPRMARARASEQSFHALGANLAHLHVVGGGFEASLGLSDGVLTVPVPDTYEHLPQKMAAACSLLAHLPQLEAVLKVDDDHRLTNRAALDAALVSVKGAACGQFGSLIRARHHGDHSRAWHFGKCSTPTLNGRPHQWFAALSWCDGAGGYMVNRAGLRAIHWADLYFADVVGAALYEDVLMSEIMKRFSGGIRRRDMHRILTSSTEY